MGAAPVMAQQRMEYRYQLTTRPVDIGTTPKGTGRRFTNENLEPWVKQGFGSVYYSEPLSLTVIELYSLLPLTQIQGLHGRHYTYVRHDGKVVRHKLEVLHEFELHLISSLGSKNTRQQVSYGDLIRRMDVQQWEDVTAFEMAVHELLTNDDYAENCREIDEQYAINGTLEDKIRLHFIFNPDWLDWFNGLPF